MRDLDNQQIAYLIDRAKSMRRRLSDKIDTKTLGEIEIFFQTLAGHPKLVDHVKHNLHPSPGRQLTKRELDLLDRMEDVLESIGTCAPERVKDHLVLMGMRDVLQGALLEDKHCSYLAMHAWGTELPDFDAEDEKDTDDGWGEDWEDEDEEDEWAEDVDDEDKAPKGDIVDDVLDLVRTAHYELSRVDKSTRESKNQTAIQRLADAIELLARNVEYKEDAQDW